MLMIGLAVLLSVAILAAFLGMSDRKRGTVIAQGVLVLGGALFFLALVGGPAMGLAPRQLATFAVGILSASSAGMLYHLYLGRFAEVRAARGTFVAVYLSLSALYAVLFLSLI